MEKFAQRGLHPRTDLGQNFLIDLNIIEQIVREARLVPDDVVLEVGCGTGGMTTFLARQAGEVISVEIDRNMYEFAKEMTEPYSNVTLINRDVLKNKNRLAQEVIDAVAEKLAVDPARRLKLIANLPYAVATPVISNLVALDFPWERMVVTVQLEMAERMCANAGSSDYSALSAWLQSQCRLKILNRLPPQVFWPRPKVNSAVVGIVPDPERREKILDRPFLQDFLRRLFTQRRKLMRGVLAGMFREELDKQQIDALLESLGFETQIRAEQLEPAQLVELCNTVRRAIETTQSEPARKT
ncbi:MAG: 16S rRNA (adenine(1518)-N(6)/adenine(1519)-N(6))-dimethyltransferase RsmA [Planctomycetaceae bacterium]